MLFDIAFYPFYNGLAAGKDLQNDIQNSTKCAMQESKSLKIPAGTLCGGVRKNVLFFHFDGNVHRGDAFLGT